MKQGTWVKKVGMVFLGLGLLAGCSGSGDTGQDVANLVEEAPAINVDQKIAEWGKFVGISTEQAKEAMISGNLAERIGKTSQLTQAEFESLVAVTLKYDKIFADGAKLVDELNARVSRMLRDRELSKRIGKAEELTVEKAELENSVIVEIPRNPEADRGEARNEYARMVSQATLVRHRLVLGAAILGFELEPKSMRDLVADPAFRTVRDAFAANLIDELFDKSIEAASQDEIIFIAEAIASVSFRINGQFLSFYEYSRKGDGDIVKIDLVRPISPSTRGGVNVLPAVDNLYIIIDEIIIDETVIKPAPLPEPAAEIKPTEKQIEEKIKEELEKKVEEKIEKDVSPVIEK